MLRILSTEQHRRNSSAATVARWGGEFAHEQWCIDPLDKMTIAEFEKLLVDRFGPEYLEPVDYAWQEGEFKPVVE